MRSEPIPEAEELDTVVPLKESALDPAHPEFWFSRLVHRKYTDLAKPSWPRHYSARIEHHGIGFYFPLGTEDRVRAASRAREIYESVLTKGWPATLQRFPREITFSIFWRRHPITCTYTTLYTDRRRIGGVSSHSRRLPGEKRVVLIEPAANVRAALEQWLERISGCRCLGVFRNARELFHATDLRGADLCLFNQHLPDLSEPEILKRVRSASPQVAAFGFGVYEQSDDIFASFSGVNEGYCLRRRAPEEMLDPIQPAWRDGATSREELEHWITRYFQDLFVLRSKSAGAHESSLLTSREQEVLNCLRKGYPDKQIAQALAIRPSTVHTHLKKIFEKLGVHTRTEAVMKYLQK